MELFCILGNIHICIFMSMAPITLFCKSSELFKNMLNMLSSFEINSSLVLSPLPQGLPSLLKRNWCQRETRVMAFPIVSGSHSFGISVHQHFVVKDYKELLDASCLLAQIYTHIWNTWQRVHFGLTACEKRWLHISSCEQIHCRTHWGEAESSYLQESSHPQHCNFPQHS